MNKLITALLLIVVAGVGLYFMNKIIPSRQPSGAEENQSTNATVSSTDNQPSGAEEEKANETVIGKSVEGRNITAFHYYGTGDDNRRRQMTRLLFVGGIHGGYSWNTVLVAYELMDYLKANPSIIPNNIEVTVIPVLNPDGLNKVVGTTGRFTSADVPSAVSATVTGRFNANNVDINRNFDCKWQPTGTWQNRTVSGGSRAFSEPESQAIKNYVEANRPAAVVTWYSAAGGVYASSCQGDISSETRAIMKEFSSASGYNAYDHFDFYEITGDMVNWLAKSNIPAISVLLTNHTDTEWDKNRKGAEALLKYYGK